MRKQWNYLANWKAMIRMLSSPGVGKEFAYLLQRRGSQEEFHLACTCDSLYFGHRNLVFFDKSEQLACGIFYVVLRGSFLLVVLLPYPQDGDVYLLQVRSSIRTQLSLEPLLHRGRVDCRRELGPENWPVATAHDQSITIDYLAGGRYAHLQPAERKLILQEDYGFLCTCKVCNKVTTSAVVPMEAGPGGDLARHMNEQQEGMSVENIRIRNQNHNQMTSSRDHEIDTEDED
ncbi:unnamed protein product [Amoebophrya sp. A25]|nr:unnamed protein product [Amoebophrya sp. A25]|eukprot:GSA25T00003427001.1